MYLKHLRQQRISKLPEGASHFPGWAEEVSARVSKMSEGFSGVALSNSGGSGTEGGGGKPATGSGPQRGKSIESLDVLAIEDDGTARPTASGPRVMVVLKKQV